MTLDSQQEIAERLYAALVAWDKVEITALLHPNFIGHATEGLPLGLGGDYKGPDAMISDFWARIGRAYAAWARPDSFRQRDDGALEVHGWYRGNARSGSELEAEFIHILTFKNGQISELDQLTDSQKWVDALGSSSDVVIYEFADGLATIRLNRPEARNAMDQATADGLLVAALRLQSQAGLRAVLITANGPVFTVGGDIKVFAAATADELPGLLRGMITPYHEALGILDRLEAPIVCAVRGMAVGGGLGLLHISDIVLADRESRFVAGFAGIGLTGDGSSTWFLPRLIGPRRAAEFYLEQRDISAAEAAEWGLVSRLVDADQLDSEALQVARKLADGPTVAFGLVRQLLRQSWDVPLSSQLIDERDRIGRAAATSDSATAIANFIARKPTRFLGE